MKNENLAIDWQAGTYLPQQEGLNHIGVAGPIAGIVKNKLIIAGGANFPAGMPWDGGSKVYQKDIYLFDIDSNGVIEYVGRQDFQDSIAYAANISFQDMIYSVGGERLGKATTDVFTYFLEGNKVVRQDSLLPDLPIPLTNGAITALEGILYFVGGENADIVSNKIYALDLNNLQADWTVFMELPKPTTHAIVVNDDEGNIIVAGGRKRNTNAKSDIYDDVYKINVDSKSIQLVSKLPKQLAAGTGVFYKGHLVVFGGDDGDTFHQVEQLIAAINTTNDANQKKDLVQRKNNIQRSHPGFSKNVWVLNMEDNVWTATHQIEGESPVTTTAILLNDLIVIPSGEIKAGVRTNQILLGKIN